ncbi:hypothetical protein [Actinocorallia sp. A-T 12471]|uniref:hypothetical protein n=1 Tax=Actinocorallia sp. A-T 12471 TaxID=3089813 RepID=UPI0029CF390E|nr:hypothetical protein [Actinocorallia sp. A-T 12471]MDX6743909.1 hypothetical protein [Actinocorallia sp. A-T 12471]
MLGIEVPGDANGRMGWGQRARGALRAAFRQEMVLPESAFDALVRAAVHDPDPSRNRQFVEPALNAFGRRRVRAALLDYLRTGSDAERAGAVRAWYWTALPLKLPQVRAEQADPEPDDRSVLNREYARAALEEFVHNEHLDVRRCILPGLALSRSAYPEELHHLVDAATAIARAHPDDYIRHRIEIQIRQ